MQGGGGGHDEGHRHTHGPQPRPAAGEHQDILSLFLYRDTSACTFICFDCVSTISMCQVMGRVCDWLSPPLEARPRAARGSIVLVHGVFGSGAAHGLTRMLPHCPSISRSVPLMLAHFCPMGPCVQASRDYWLPSASSSARWPRPSHSMARQAVPRPQVPCASCWRVQPTWRWTASCSSYWSTGTTPPFYSPQFPSLVHNLSCPRSPPLSLVA